MTCHTEAPAGERPVHVLGARRQHPRRRGYPTPPGLKRRGNRHPANRPRPRGRRSRDWGRRRKRAWAQVSQEDPDRTPGRLRTEPGHPPHAMPGADMERVPSRGRGCRKARLRVGYGTPFSASPYFPFPEFLLRALRDPEPPRLFPNFRISRSGHFLNFRFSSKAAGCLLRSRPPIFRVRQGVRRPGRSPGKVICPAAVSRVTGLALVTSTMFRPGPPPDSAGHERYPLRPVPGPAAARAAGVRRAVPAVPAGLAGGPAG